MFVHLMQISCRIDTISWVLLNFKKILDWAVKLYERYLMVYDNYLDYWICYEDFMETKRKENY